MPKRKSKIGIEKDSKRPKLEQQSENGRDQGFYNAVLSSIGDLKDENGEFVDEMYRKLPHKKWYPDYYQTIQQPISLHEITQKARNEEYSSSASMEDFLADFELMLTNAQQYNEKDSLVCKHGEIIFAHVQDKVQEYQANKNTMLQILDELVKYKTKKDKRKLSDWFMVEPSSEDYPTYREIVAEPMSFTTAQERVESGQVASLDDFQYMVQLIFTNSKAFNGEDSQVYADTEELEGVFHQKIEAALEEAKANSNLNRQKRSQKIKISLGKSSSDSQNVGQGSSSRKGSTAGVSEPDQDDSEGDQDHDDDDERDELENDEEYDEQKRQQQEHQQQLSKEEEDERRHQAAVASVVDEVRTREPGKSANDALISKMSVTSLIPHTSRYFQQKNIYPMSRNDLFQFTMPASNKYTVRSHAFALPSYHHTIHINVLLNESLHERRHSVGLTHGEQKITPLQTTVNNPWAENTPPKMKFEVGLRAGLNRLELSCTASQPQPRQRAASAALTQTGFGEDAETERITLWIMLTS